MASRTDIANLALLKLGEAPVTDITDNVKAGRAMNARYEHLRDAELAAHAWRFAVKRVNLAESVEIPAWGYSTVYERPSDDLRPLKVDSAVVNAQALGVTLENSGYALGGPAYEIIDGKIHADLSAPLKYEYVSRVTSEGYFPVLFTEVLSCRLALDAAEELTQSATKIDRIAQQYKAALSEARKVNSLWGPPTRKRSGSFAAARFW